MLDRIIPGLTVLLRQAGMRCHPAHPLLAPLRAIDHLRQVFVQNASLRMQSYGDQWLRTIPPAANRLLQSAVGKQLRQETWDKHIAAERILKDKNEFFINPMVSAVALMCQDQPCSEPLPCHVAGFLQDAQWKGGHAYAFCPCGDAASGAPLQRSAPTSAKPMPWVPLASQASYGVTLPSQSLSALSAPDERDSFLVEKQVSSQLFFNLSACVLVRPFHLVNCRSGSSQIFKQSKKHLRRSPRSQQCLQTSAGGMAARRKQGPAAWPSQGSRMALLLRSGAAWIPWEAPWQLLLGL